MPETHYFWDIDAVPIPQLNCDSAEDVCQKLRKKFGNGSIVVVGDRSRLVESGSTAIGTETIR